MGFRAAYAKRPRTETDDDDLLAQAWQAANEKARELRRVSCSDRGTTLTNLSCRVG
jgi:hypothetical protein